MPPTVGTGSSTDTIHLGGGEALFRAAVVRGQGLGIDCRGQIVLLEPPQTEVGELRDPLILSRESIRRNRSVEQTSPAWMDFAQCRAPRLVC